LALTGLLTFSVALSYSQSDARRDKIKFESSKNEFLEQVEKDANTFKDKTPEAKKSLSVDFSRVKGPSGVQDFKAAWHNPPISQGLSGMCWCFSTTSFYESEVHRLSGKEVKLSELYTVYWEYVEKAKRFVHERGKSAFGEGSEANAVARIWKQYGIVPAGAYSGMLPGQKVHDHRAMYGEMNDYLKSVKSSNAWNEDLVVATIKSIMNRYIGEPPTTVAVGGTTMTPKEYLARELKLNPSDYVEVLSLLEKPMYSKVEYEVPDNWWHNSDYLNVPLDEFMAALKKAVRNGYTVSIGGDTSEPGLDGHAGMAIIPTFDIPAEYIDEQAREFRFSNRTTTDDHGIHVVGITTVDGKDWFLIKDSGSGSRNNLHPGYYYYREDYVKLKMMGFTVHRDMVTELLKKVTVMP
jgi:bleomycin hydrolase